MILKVINGYDEGDLKVTYWEDEMDLPGLIYEEIDKIARQEFKMLPDCQRLKDYECFNRLVGAQREELKRDFSSEIIKVNGPGSENRYSVDFFQIITPYKQDYFGTTGLNYQSNTNITQHSGALYQK